ncbi:MAG TPA: TIGR00341 family protein [Rhodocyclaceae bacterium]|nr:TIGR00341 family protein [Rhodocyclaceae bacterium]
MNTTPSTKPIRLMTRFRHSLAARFSLQEDKAHDDLIDESLRNGVELRGATPWVLIFAIFIASVGLNVNSTAVIIGAMLVSPLMGPIMGIGYGIGIYDFPLIRKSLLNLGIATLISLLTSTLYFLLTPLSEAQSELLARTTPTIWDVLIALFGGLAGIVGATRKEKSNVIPGVAIATALMPPLCTAGYGLANANWSFFFGAFYLFSINCVFIAFGTVIVIELLKLPHKKFIDPHIESRVKQWLFAIVILTTLPSIYLAYNLVQNEIFNNKARQFIAREFHFENTHVMGTRITSAAKRIEVTLIGEPISQTTLHTIESRLGEGGLAGASVIIHQTENNRIDVTSLKAGIVSDLYRDSQYTLNEREQEIRQLQQELANSASWRSTAADIAQELKAQFPGFREILIGEGIEPADDRKLANRQVALLSAKSSEPLGAGERQRIEDWFKARTKSISVRLFIEAPIKNNQPSKKHR